MHGTNHFVQRIGDFYTEHDGITDEDAVNVGPCVVIEQF